MTVQVSVLGIDGSGKSTVAAALPALLAAEGRLLTGSAGEDFYVFGPEEDHLAPGFHPDGLPLTARLARRFKRLAKRCVDRRKLYPFFKLGHMIFQDDAARRLADRSGAAVMVSDGNTLLSAAGRAANYRRPASEGLESARSAPEREDLAHLFAYLLEGAALPPDSRGRLPRVEKAQPLLRLCRLLKLRAPFLPDVVLFLDLSPGVAVTRIASRGGKVDLHENEADLAQAREMYLKTLEAFRLYRPDAQVYRVTVDGRSPGEVLSEAVGLVQASLQKRAAQAPPATAPLGTTATRLTGGGVWSKVFNYRYLVRYLLAHWFRGSWRELTFPLSGLGRLFLKEGYSAGVMRVIYDRDVRDYGLLDRCFLEYSLHRAVYDRLQILAQRIRPEIEARLDSGAPVRIFTAPSGFAYDLFRPLAELSASRPGDMGDVDIVAADLDPHGALADELRRRAQELGIGFTFLRGDITSDEFRDRLELRAPFDLALFVGLSSWLPKPDSVRHLQWVRRHLRPQGLLISDCFTPDSYALSGRYVGYKATYYTPANYRALLDYCGFDGLRAQVQSGRDRINHVILAPPRPLRERSESRPAGELVRQVGP